MRFPRFIAAVDEPYLVLGCVLFLTGCPFGDDGYAPRPFDAGVEEAHAVALDDQGRIVVAGWHQAPSQPPAMAVIRFTSNGQIDTGFGDDGVVLIYLSLEGTVATDVAIQPDGKIVVAGEIEGYADEVGVGTYDHVGVARLEPDGSLDPGFGDDGIFVIEDDTRYDDRHVDAVLIQPDGRILVVGHDNSDDLDHYTALLIRLTADGELDGSFGDGGMATPVDTFGGLEALMLPDGRFVVSGQAADRGGALFRFEVDGTLDASFGDGGIARNDGCDWALEDLVRTGGGGFVAVGGGCFGAFTEDGEVDEAFGDGGAVELEVTHWYGDPPIGGVYVSPVGIALDSRDRLYGVGAVWDTLDGRCPGVVVRLKPEGSPDPAFGEDGMRRLIPGSKFTSLEDVVVDDEDRVIAVGWSMDDVEGGGLGDEHLLVTRLLP